MRLLTPIIGFILVLYPLFCIPTSLSDTLVIRWFCLLTVGLLSLVLLLRYRLLLIDHCMVPLGLFIVCAFISAILSQHPVEAWLGISCRFTGFLSYLCFAVLFLVALNVGRSFPERTERIINAWLWSTGLVSVIGILQYLGVNLVPFGLDLGKEFRSYSTIGNWNHLATYLLLAFPFAASRFLSNSTVLSAGTVALIYGAILTSLTRGAWVALAVGLVVLYLATQEKKRLISLLGLMLVVTLVVLPINDWTLLNRLTTASDQASLAMQGAPETGSGRFLLWQEGLKALPESPVFGSGPDTYIFVSEKLQDWLGSDYPAKAHNIYLEIAVTMGIPALCFYIWFLWSLIRRARTDRPFESACLLMLAMYTVQGIFLVDVLTVYPLFWVLSGLFVGTQNPGNAGYLFNSPCPR